MYIDNEHIVSNEHIYNQLRIIYHSTPKHRLRQLFVRGSSHAIDVPHLASNLIYHSVSHPSRGSNKLWLVAHDLRHMFSLCIFKWYAEAYIDLINSFAIFIL